MQHRFSTTFTAIYRNKLHIFAVPFTVASGVLICFLTTILPCPRSLAISFRGIFELIVSLRNRTAEKKDGKTLVCDKRDRAISYFFCRDLHLTLIFSGLFQKDLLFGVSYLKQNYCHACHTRFAVFFPLLSCCVSYLIIREL